MEITTLARQAAAGILLEALELKPGSELAVRVHSAPQGGGRGVISLAGLLLPADLPAGVAAGERLAVRLVAAGSEQLTLRLLTNAGPAAPGAGVRARAAGALATTGDRDLLQIAVGLQPQGLALPLPNGDALTLAVPPEPEGEAGGSGLSAGDAAFVLYSALYGAIAVRLRLGGGVVSAEVTVEPRVEAAAAAAAPALRKSLERATGARASVAVSARPPEGPRPPAPRIDPSLDAYA
jgi:hypothetical protein